MRVSTNANELSRDQYRKQATRSSTWWGATPCYCGRSGQTNLEPALWWLAPLTTCDLNRQCSDRSPFISYPTGCRSRRRRLAAAGAGELVQACWSCCMLCRADASKIETPDFRSLSPIEIAILSPIHALDSDARFCGNALQMLASERINQHIELRICPTFFKRSLTSRFLHSEAPPENVGHNSFNPSTRGLMNRGVTTVGQGGKGGARRVWELVPMPARGVRRLPSLVLPNNCVEEGAKW